MSVGGANHDLPAPRLANCRNRIDASRPLRRHVTREKRHRRQTLHDCDERQRIIRSDTVELGGDELVKLNVSASPKPSPARVSRNPFNSTRLKTSPRSAKSNTNADLTHAQDLSEVKRARLWLEGD